MRLDSAAGEIGADKGEYGMWDAGCLAATVFFFLVAIGYTRACERLGRKAGG